jgi:hypothetical protein
LIVPSIVTVVFLPHVAAVAAGATETTESATAETTAKRPSFEAFFILIMVLSLPRFSEANRSFAEVYGLKTDESRFGV